jgi:hypothetical protein
VTVRKRQGPYFLDLDLGVQLRWEFEREKKRILSYVVQLEVNEGKGWKVVLRYDTAHAVPHGDVYRKSGRSRKVMHPGIDTTYDEVLGWGRSLISAREDITFHWETYCARFREGGWPA